MSFFDMTFQGKKNLYFCHACGHGFVTIDRDRGTTPFSTGCKQPLCKGMAQSFFYRAPQEVLAPITPAFEWYRPNETELIAMSPATLDHVARGGLIMRPYIAPATEAET